MMGASVPRSSPRPLLYKQQSGKVILGGGRGAAQYLGPLQLSGKGSCTTYTWQGLCMTPLHALASMICISDFTVSLVLVDHGVVVSDQQ